jgi:predicted PurR-regulated permease PerM
MGRKIFSFAVAAAFLYLVSPLLLPVIMGGILAILFFPWLERLERRKLSTPAASGILTMGITLVVLLPASVLTFLGAKAGLEQLRAFKDAPKVEGSSWTEQILLSDNFRPFLERFSTWFPNGMEELVQMIHDVSGSIGLKLGELLGMLVSQLPALTMAVVIIVVSVYFFLVDGRKLVYFVRRNSVWGPLQTDQILTTFENTCRSVLLASVVSGAVQSLLETIVCVAVGVPNPLLIGLLVFLGSFVPVVGSAPVTFGIAVYQFLMGHTAVGIILLVTAIVVSIVDNVVRPAFLKGSANLHPLLAFVAAFGGLQTLGFSGIFLGPIVAAVFVITIQILTTEESDLPIETPDA